MQCSATRRFNSAVARQVSRPQTSGRKTSTKAFGQTQLVISGATATLLAVGRFAAMPWQRARAEEQVPSQNGKPHEDAGDTLATDASFIMNSNDPAGFNIIDVLAYGALGHALGFFLLGAGSLWAAGTKPTPF